MTLDAFKSLATEPRPSSVLPPALVRYSRATSSVRRCLFGRVDDVQSQNYLNRQMEAKMRENVRKYNFDFLNEIPIDGPDAAYEWTCMDSSEVPEMYAQVICGDRLVRGANAGDDGRFDFSTLANTVPKSYPISSTTTSASTSSFIATSNGDSTERNSRLSDDDENAAIDSAAATATTDLDEQCVSVSSSTNSGSGREEKKLLQTKIRDYMKNTKRASSSNHNINGTFINTTTENNGIKRKSSTMSTLQSHTNRPTFHKRRKNSLAETPMDVSES